MTNPPENNTEPPEAKANPAPAANAASAASPASAVSPASKKSDLGVRMMSALVMLAILGTAMWLGGRWFDALVLLVGVVCLSEMARLVNAAMETRASRVIGLLLGLFYVGLAVYSLISLPIGVVMGVIAVVIATDTGAYFSGRSIGGPKIAPKISPSKTWAGLIGGAIAAGAVSSGFFLYNMKEVGFSPMVLMALIIGAGLAVLAQSGDFLESWLKRKAGVKDSANFIPGHGGVFDRVDGLLPVSIAAYLLWMAHP